MSGDSPQIISSPVLAIDPVRTLEFTARCLNGISGSSLVVGICIQRSRTTKPILLPHRPSLILRQSWSLAATHSVPSPIERVCGRERPVPSENQAIIAPMLSLTVKSVISLWHVSSCGMLKPSLPPLLSRDTLRVRNQHLPKRVPLREVKGGVADNDIFHVWLLKI